ncbi:UNVERIFIED_ORG: threonine/homoserine/homoserine lactone efflux protein [Rhizobium etli]
MSYLVYIAVNIWKGAGRPLEVSDAVHGRRAPMRSFTTALLTQLSNPKTIIVYASLFAALLPRTVPLDLIFALPLGVFAVEAGWYSIVAIAFSARHPRRLYLHAKGWIDRAAGAVMGGLGLRLILSGLSVR